MHHTGRTVLLRASPVVVAAVASLLLLVGCTTSAVSDEEAFCETLRAEVLASPNASESTQPAELSRTADVLADLADTAPAAIDATAGRLAELFDEARRTSRSDLPDFLRSNQDEMGQLSDQFNAYAIRQCGVVLQRAAPTPTPVGDAVNVTE